MSPSSLASGQDISLVSVRPRLRTMGRGQPVSGVEREVAKCINQNGMQKLVTAVRSPLTPDNLVETGSCPGAVQQLEDTIEREEGELKLKNMVRQVEAELKLVKLMMKDVGKQMERQRETRLEDVEWGEASGEDIYLETVRPRLSKNKHIKNISATMGSTEDFGMVNKTTTVKKDDGTAFSDEVLTKVRRKTCDSVSSLLRATAEEFHPTPIITSLPKTILTNLLSILNLPHIGITAVVKQPGYISLKLRQGMVLDLSANLAIRLNNTTKNCSISMSACTNKMALEHPMGRVLQYGPTVEVQAEDNISIKNAKIFPRGINFTANNTALVYLLDKAGARSTSGVFYDLYATDIVDTLFVESSQQEKDVATSSTDQLDRAKYWRTAAGVNCWMIGQVFVQQTEDGFVIVERKLPGGDKIFLRSSPLNGSARFLSRFVKMTASLNSTRPHMFLKSEDRCIYYMGQTKVFTVLNAGVSAGFNKEGNFTIELRCYD